VNTIRSGYRIGNRHWFRHWLSPRTYTNYFKWKWQRAQRGWADCDIWSLDMYLCAWLPDALALLAIKKHGTPCTMFEGNGDAFGNFTPAEYDAAEARWQETLAKMVLAFKAHERQSTLDYPKDLSGADYRRLIQIDQKVFEEGAALFIKYFGSLWD
jgi:hypothetical protein